MHVDYAPMRVSPSPRDLFDRLTDEEKVAIDLIQQNLDAPVDAKFNEQLQALVPSEGRRGYLRTLAIQLPSCVGNAGLDNEAKEWAATRSRQAKEARQMALEREAAIARDRAWLETLSPVVRRSVERRRRRHTRR